MKTGELPIAAETNDLKIQAFVIAESYIAKDPSLNAVYEMANSLIHMADFLSSRLEDDKAYTRLVQCSSGCSSCCHAQVRISWPEAIFLERFILQTFSDADIKNLLLRASGNREKTEGKSLACRVKIKAETPCVFLMDNTCMVYAGRPLICRSWHSLERVACENAFSHDDHTAEIDTLPHRNYIYNTIREVFVEMCSQYGLDNHIYELPFIVEKMISKK